METGIPATSKGCVKAEATAPERPAARKYLHQGLRVIQGSVTGVIKGDSRSLERTFIKSLGVREYRVLGLRGLRDLGITGFGV